MKLSNKKITVVKDVTGQIKSIPANSELKVIGVTPENYEVLLGTEKFIIGKQKVDSGVFEIVEGNPCVTKEPENTTITKEELTQKRLNFLEEKESIILTKEQFDSNKTIKLKEKTANLKAQVFDIIATEMNLAVEQYKLQFEIVIDKLFENTAEEEYKEVVNYIHSAMTKKGFKVEQTPTGFIFE